MTRDPTNRLEKIVQAALKRHQELERITERFRKIIDPPSLRRFRKALERQQQRTTLAFRSMLQVNKSLRISPATQSMIDSVSHLQELQESIDTATAGVRNTFANVHQTWQLDSTIQKLAADAERTQAQLRFTGLAQMKLMEVSSLTSVTEAVFREIDFEEIKRSVQLPDDAFAQMQGQVEVFCTRYDELLASFEQPEQILTLPNFVLPSSGMEVLFEAMALRSLDAKPVEREEKAELDDFVKGLGSGQECRELLLDRFPELVIPYDGAVESAVGDNPDKTRHVFASMRELTDHLLRELAPSEEVKSWTDDPAMYDKGKPTRKARVLYICRKASHGPFGNFVHEDATALIRLIGNFQRLHKVDNSISEDQLGSLIKRTQTWIEFMLNISQADD